jgi:hypothetical protein
MFVYRVPLFVVTLGWQLVAVIVNPPTEPGSDAETLPPAVKMMLIQEGANLVGDNRAFRYRHTPHGVHEVLSL